MSNLHTYALGFEARPNYVSRSNAQGFGDVPQPCTVGCLTGPVRIRIRRAGYACTPNHLRVLGCCHSHILLNNYMYIHTYIHIYIYIHIHIIHTHIHIYIYIYICHSHASLIVTSATTPMPRTTTTTTTLL